MSAKWPMNDDGSVEEMVKGTWETCPHMSSSGGGLSDSTTSPFSTLLSFLETNAEISFTLVRSPAGVAPKDIRADWEGYKGSLERDEQQTHGFDSNLRQEPSQGITRPTSADRCHLVDLHRTR
jgi:hypothetical protein